MSKKKNRDRGIIPLNPHHEGRKGGLIPAGDLEAQRRMFETPAREITMSEVASYYNVSERGFDVLQRSGQNKLIPAIMSKLPTIVGKYNTMEQYRKRKGWSEQRTKLEATISGMLSFDEGLYRLKKAAEKHSFVADIRRYATKAKTVEFDDEETLLIGANLTAEEVTWLSVLKEIPASIYEDNLIQTTTILDHFYDGVEWGYDTLHSREGDTPRDTYQAAGLTGVRADTSFTKFEAKFQAALVAYYYHVIGDADIFQRVWEDAGFAAIMSGDGKLLRAFAARKRRRFTDEWAIKARRVVNKWLLKLRLVNVAKAEVMKPKDVLKLIGMLEYCPPCLFDGRQLGFVPSGKGVMFLDANLGEIEYVSMDPYVGHLAETEIQRSAGSVDRTNKIWYFIFDRIRKAIEERNIQEGKYAFIDEIAGDLFLKYGIKVQLGVRKTLTKKVEKLWYGVETEYSCKMGYWDIVTISDILKEIPLRLLTAVKKIKREHFMYTMEEHITGTSKWGDFDKETGTLNVSHPWLKELTSWDELQFQFGMAHELTHGMAASDPELMKWWRKLSRASKNFPVGERFGEFLTAYASRDKEEDLADTVACFMVFGDEFRKQSQHSKILKAKYEFVKRIFGKEFPQKTKETIEGLNGPLTFDFDLHQKMQETTEESVEEGRYKRIRFQDMKDAQRPLVGPKIESTERKNQKPGKQTVHIEREPIIRRILRNRLRKKFRWVAEHNVDYHLAILGRADVAAKDIANRTGIELDRATAIVEEIIRAVNDHVEKMKAVSSAVGEKAVGGWEEDDEPEDEEEDEGEGEEEDEGIDYDEEDET